jgi:hypothetical protein
VSRPRHVVTGVAFEIQTGGLIVEYVTPEIDARANGLTRNHTIAIPADDEFDDLIGGLQRKAHSLLTTALASFEDSEPLQVGDDEIDDDAPAPYDNPLER